MQTTPHVTTQPAPAEPLHNFASKKETITDQLKQTAGRFHPVPIRGESLSETILRDRGRL